ncbi:MAG: hypothetical protein JRH20_17225 [Deltaproteobacteria bacterium]|nr:hypothetical protein [Deltaproteobacteria bacterium]
MSPEALEAIKSGLPLALVGLALVFAVQILTTLAVSGMRRIDEGWRVKEVVEAQQALERPPTIDATTLVLITATVTAVMQRQVAIRRIRRLAPATSQRSWQQQGRTAIQTSHQVRK